MKTKNILLLALIGSVSAGIYYMGKSTVIKRLKEQGDVQEVIDDNGKTKNVLTNKGSNSVVAKAEVVKQIENSNTQPFDYNNPQYHSSKNYWLGSSTGTFYLDVYKDGNKTDETIEITIDNDSVEPTIKESIKQGLKTVIPFWK